MHRRTAAVTAMATPEEEKEDTFQEPSSPSPSPSLLRTPTGSGRVGSRVGGAAAIVDTTESEPETDINAAFAQIRGDLIGRLDSVGTPFGSRPLVCECWCWTP